MIRTKISIYVVGAMLGAGLAQVAWAAPSSLESKVARAVMAAQVMAERYMVTIKVQFKKQVALKDRMLRSPRRPANPNQVIAVSRVQTECLGVLVSQGTRVVLPEVCTVKGGYTLDKISLQFANGKEISVAPSEVSVKEDVAWLRVDTAQTKGLSYVTVKPVTSGKSLQEAFGDAMTQHLKQFFRARGVVQHRRCRPGLVYSEPRLQLGEPLFYDGKLVALVKTRVRTYGGLLGGVSESAFAIIR